MPRQLDLHGLWKIEKQAYQPEELVAADDITKIVKTKSYIKAWGDNFC